VGKRRSSSCLKDQYLAQEGWCLRGVLKKDAHGVEGSQLGEDCSPLPLRSESPPLKECGGVRNGIGTSTERRGHARVVCCLRSRAKGKAGAGLGQKKKGIPTAKRRGVEKGRASRRGEGMPENVLDYWLKKNCTSHVEKGGARPPPGGTGKYLKDRPKDGGAEKVASAKKKKGKREGPSTRRGGDAFWANTRGEKWKTFFAKKTHRSAREKKKRTP